MPDTPPRLDIVFQKYDPPLFFVTFNTDHRKKLLCNVQVHEEFRRLLNQVKNEEFQSVVMSSCRITSISLLAGARISR